MIASSVSLGFISLCLFVYILNVASDIIIPFVIAIVVWYLINAIAGGFRALELGTVSMPRSLSFVLAILTLSYGFWALSQLIGRNITDVIAEAPLYQQKFEGIARQIRTLLPEEQRPSVSELVQYLNIGTVVTILAKTFTGIAGKTLVVLFYTGFLLYEQRFFDRKIEGMFKGTQEEKRFRTIMHNIDAKMRRYIWVKVLMSGITGVLTYVLLRFVGVDFADFWGLMAFVLNFIPYVGSLVAIIMPTIITLVQFDADPSVVLFVAGGLSIIQISIGSVLDPRMLGDTLNLSPIAIIFSLATWGMIWGIPGMFLSIPILAAVVITFTQFDATRPIAILLSKTGDLDSDEPAPLPEKA